MAKSKVRVAIVGMGIGKPNGRAIAANEHGEVAALCDLDTARMDEFADELPHDPKRYTDYKKLCKDPDIDAIFVGTPNQLHVPIALEAVRNDKHVMVTKPLDLDLTTKHPQGIVDHHLVGAKMQRNHEHQQYVREHHGTVWPPWPMPIV